MIKDWWKWGDHTQLKNIDDYPKMKAYLEDRWGITLKFDFTPPASMELPQIPEKKKEQIRDIFASIPTRKISFKNEDRLKFALGKSYYDVIRICKGGNIDGPDAVITPVQHKDVEYILAQASEHNVAVIPFGGGTNVVGALTLSSISSKYAHKICINLSEMNKLIHLDETCMTATFQAGIFGPALEKILQEKGFTLGHFPQSFEYSSLGGWVVTRSAGQESTHYGKIEDLVEGLTIATPTGTIKTPHFTHEAAGINIMQLFVGSEGTLGVVTEVRVKIRKKPKTHRWVIGLLPDFESGKSALKEMIQQDIRPSVVRFSDFSETSMFSKLASATVEEGLIGTLKKEAQKWLLKYKNLEQPNLMILRFEEMLSSTSALAVNAKNIIESKGGMLLGNTIGENWEHSRFALPYLRDTLVEHRIFIDTYETIVPWDQVVPLHDALIKELNRNAAFGKEKGIFMAHISHVYPVGACVYFTVITKMQAGKEIEQWQEIKTLMTDTILRHEGSVSHHHGVGLDHQKWYLNNSDPLSLEVLKAVKQRLDPKGILNPGKLFHV
jgi:alkyldihydroxyacetonephosphate synthase